jgi:hypothetical protein
LEFRFFYQGAAAGAAALLFPLNNKFIGGAWPEDFGPFGGPTSGPNNKGPFTCQGPTNGTRGAQLLSIFSQVNNIPDTAPAKPPLPRAPKNL